MLLDRYLIREISMAFVIVAGVLTVIFIAYSLTQFLTDAAAGLLKTREVAELTFYKSLIALEVLLPLAFYFGVIVSFGRLNVHSEYTAMRACGLRQARLQRPLIVLSLLVAAGVAALSLSVRPWAYNHMYALKDTAEAASEIDRIKPQRFYLYEDNERVAYVEAIAGNGRDLAGVFIRKRTDDALEVISAPRGELTPFFAPDHHQLGLAQASIVRSTSGGTDFIGRFEHLTLALRASAPVTFVYRTKAESTAALFASTHAQDLAELEWRLSTPVSTILLTFMALSMIDARPRQGQFSRLPLAIAIYAVYFNLRGVARTWVEQSVAPTSWWVPALLATVIIVLFVKRRQQLT